MPPCIHVVIFSIINVFVICFLCSSSFALIKNVNRLVVCVIKLNSKRNIHGNPGD
jgi:hypothetical protein